MSYNVPMTYSSFYLERKESLIDELHDNIQSKLLDYCVNTFHSQLYYFAIADHLENGIIQITGEECWNDTFVHSCSPYIKATSLIRTPYSFDIREDDVNFPPFTRTLTDLTMVVKRLQVSRKSPIRIEDFGIFLYIVYSNAIEELHTNRGFSKEHAAYTVQQLIRQFLCSISSIEELSFPRVSLVMHDSLGMFKTLKLWNDTERAQQLRRKPMYAVWDPKLIGEFYSSITPLIQDYKTSSSGFVQPQFIFKRTEYLPKLDRIFVGYFLNEYFDKRTPDMDRDFLKVVTKRFTLGYYKFGKKYLSEEHERKLELAGRKFVRCCLDRPFTEPAIYAWNTSDLQVNKLCKFEYYDPFTTEISAEPIFANTVIDCEKLTEEELQPEEFKKIYLEAQTINQVRRLHYGDDGDAVFMALNVDIKNVTWDNVSAIKEVLDKANEELTSTYMDNFSYTIHEDFTSLKPYSGRSDFQKLLKSQRHKRLKNQSEADEDTQPDC